MSNPQPITIYPSAGFDDRARDAINDPALRQSFRGAMDFLMMKRAAQFPDADELARLRTLGQAIRQRCLARLPELLETLEASLTRNGIQVHWADTPAEANALIHGITKESVPSEIWRQIFCIIGGGFVGISALLRLAAPSASGPTPVR